MTLVEGESDLAFDGLVSIVCQSTESHIGHISPWADVSMLIIKGKHVCQSTDSVHLMQSCVHPIQNCLNVAINFQRNPNLSKCY